MVSIDPALLLRVFVATLLGGVIGWDRERKNRPAGLRTHMLVAMSSALFVVVGDVYQAQELRTSGQVEYDPLRVLQAVATGVSFLGAGTVFVNRDRRVEGLTTAASLLAASGVGMASGLGAYALALAATALVAVVLAGAQALERYIDKPGE